MLVALSRRSSATAARGPLRDRAITVETTQPTTVRASFVKAAVERGLIWSGVARFARRRMSGRVLVLAYHNIVPDEATPSGDLANHLPRSRFAAQLDVLRSTHDIVPLEASLEKPRSGSKPRVAITFDDAYLGAVTLGIEELVRRRMPATIFVAPAFLGGRSFWWDALAVPGDGLEPNVRSRALDDLAGDDTAIRAWAEGDGIALGSVPPGMCASSEADLSQAASSPGITLGSHTWSHQNLTRLAATELAAELSRPREWLRDRFPKSLDWLAYPYGEFDERVEKAAADAGYEAALAVSGGWFVASPPDRFALPRVNVPPGLSRHGLSLRGAGLLCS